MVFIQKIFFGKNVTKKDCNFEPFCLLIKSKEVCNGGVACKSPQARWRLTAMPSITKFLNKESVTEKRT